MVNDYSLLARLPLLGGISSTDLLGWEETLRLSIDEFAASRVPLIRQGDRLQGLLWLAEGELNREHQSPDGRYATRSVVKAPAVIEPDRIFGLTPSYRFSYSTRTDVRMLCIRKSDVVRHLLKNEVFRLNLLSLLSALSQKQDVKLRPQQFGDAEDKFVHFLQSLFPADASGEVEISIKMTDLARYLGETRLTISRLLNEWSARGDIRLGRGHFVVPDIGNLPSAQH